MDTVESLRKMIWRKSYRAKVGDPYMSGLVFAKDENSAKVELASNLKVPKLSTTEVLVRVHCAAINPVDLAGKVASEPVGVEFVGTIEKLGWVRGDKVHMFPFAIGQVVLGMCEAGALSEFVRAEAHKISYRPDGMANEQAAAFSVSGLTAHQALRNNNFSSGQTIMVIGASNATGAMFVRQARLLGASKIIVADFESKLDFLETLDPDAIINLDAEKLTDAVAPGECNMIVDAVSDPRNPLDVEPFEPQCYTLLAPNAKFFAVNANPLDQLRKIIADAVGLNVQRRNFDTLFVEPRHEEIEQLAEWFEAGELEQSIDSVINFEDIDAINTAYARLKANEACGKIVVQFPPNAPYPAYRQNKA